VLVDENLVLTARHCIARPETASASCDAEGNSANGDQLGDDVDPASISVYAGERIDVREPPSALGARLVHTSSRVMCNADIAYVVLDRRMPDAQPLPLATTPSREGSAIVTIGYGGGPMNVKGLRAARPIGELVAVGPLADRTTGKVLGPREIEIASATCTGDSGGPVVDLARGSVVGVVSRGAGCTLAGNHVATRVDAFADLTELAREAARSAASDR
jgi:hypothetical protein